jgi:hypothetical protein
MHAYAMHTLVKPISDLIREHAQDNYLRPARRRGEATVAINAGTVHKALALHNRVPAVCQALKSKKFLDANHLKLVSETGPQSGQSTTVTYTYEFVEGQGSGAAKYDPWRQLRGALKDIFAELGGGEAFLRAERQRFYSQKDSK